MIYLYNSVIYLFSPIIVLRLVFRGFKNSAYFLRWSERFAWNKIPHHENTVWIHAVSVGEVKAATPMIQSIRRQHPKVHFLVTTMTATGAQQVKTSLGDQATHQYIPYDFPGAVRRFLKQVQPLLVIVMETEIWPNLIRTTRARNIPLVYANVRLSERSYLRYKRFSSLLGPLLALVNGFAVQSQADAERVKLLGASLDAVRVTGSIKFEIRLPASLQEIAKVLRREWGVDRRVWVAGSTREGEEQLVLTVYGRLKQKLSDLLLVLVPRHPERFNSVAKMCQSSGLKIVRRSESEGNLASDADVYIGDTMGELQMFYAAADVVFVGGSLVPTGGHNVLEACAAGVPVVFGPHMFNFLDISYLTVERGAGTQVQNVYDLEKAVENYFSDADLRFSAGEKGKQLVEENRGALVQTLALLTPYLESKDLGEYTG